MNLSTKIYLLEIYLLRFRVACLMDTPRTTIFLFFCCSMLIKKNLRIRVPGHRRLAISRLRVPNLDGAVATAAGNLLSIGAPRHRVDPEIVRNQDTNQQTQTEKVNAASTGNPQIASPKS